MGIEEIEKAVVSLPEQEYKKFRRWFFERDWERWDEEIEQDVQSGRLDQLVKEADDAKRFGKLGEL